MKKNILLFFTTSIFTLNTFSQSSSVNVTANKSDSTVLNPHQPKKIESIELISEEDTATHKKSSTVYTQVEKQAEFPGGITEMMKFIQKNCRYPKRARKKGITGKCFLKFVITNKGDVTNVEVLKGVPGCPECDEEAIRVVKSMPTWKPGYIDNRAVHVYYTIPFSFKIQNF